MGPSGPREALELAIRKTGCRVRRDPIRGGLVAIDCPTYQARAALVDVFAWDDALYDGDVRRLALELTSDLPALHPFAIGRRIHSAVQRRVRFVGEAGDQIQTPLETWSYRAGDCDCQTRLVLALLRSLGVDCTSFSFEKAGSDKGDGGGKFVAHIVGAQQLPRGELIWLETTLPAAYGEHPLDAARRLGVERRDLQ